MFEHDVITTVYDAGKSTTIGYIRAVKVYVENTGGKKSGRFTKNDFQRLRLQHKFGRPRVPLTVIRP